MAMYLGSNKVEIGTSSGGSGSSDFSTAQVTVVNNNEYGLNMPAVYNAGELSPEAPAFLYTASMGYQGVFTIALYKGAALVEIPFGDDVAIEGNITDMGDGFYFITGDCTITIS